MTKKLMIAALVLGTAFAAPAAAQLVVNPNGTVTINSAGAGGAVTFNFNGIGEGYPGPGGIPGISSSLTLTFINALGGDYNFSYSLFNSSGAPITAARVTGFGFDVDAPVNVAESLAAGTFQFNAWGSGSIANSQNVDFCVVGSNGSGEQNNCAGNQGGPGIGQTSTGTFTLDLLNADDGSIVLSDFHTRYQGIDSTQLDIAGGSGTGNVIPPVPEPGTWALMLLGFAAVGAGLRRSRKRGLRLLQIA